MDPGEERRARQLYRMLKRSAGRPPVVYAGERYHELAAAFGTQPVSLWWAARFDASTRFRRQALVAAVDHLRAGIVRHIQWLEHTDPPMRSPHGDLSGWGIHDTTDYLDRARATNPYGGLAPHPANGDPARKVLAQLAADAATLDLDVTERDVTDTHAKPRQES